MSDFDFELDWLKQWELYSPDKVAIEDYKNQKNYTYQELFFSSKKIAFYLKKLDIKFGDRVAVLSQNRVETVILFFALQRLGAILVPINFRLSPTEIEFILKDCEPKVLFYEQDFEFIVQEINSKHSLKDKSDSALSLKCLPYQDLSQPETISEFKEFEGSEETPVMILYTSGTTGFPKGAVLTHKMLFWNSINTSLSLNLTENDVTINFAPLFHTGGWNVLMTPFLHRGAKIIFFDKFDADQILKVSSQKKVTLLFGVPTMLKLMSESNFFTNCDLKSLRYMVVGGEPMPLNLIQTWNSKGVPIRQGFGLTEFGPNCFSLAAEDAESKMGSIGRPNFYVRTKIIDSTGREVKVGEIGELLLSGPSCMKGYWNNSTATELALQKGWLLTGDLVRQDEDQYFYVVGRKKEMFISGGENVYPVEVERVLGQHPLVREVAVIGVQDPKWGEVGHAYIALKQSDKDIQESKDKADSLETDFTSFCKAHLAKYKIPKYFSFIKDLPKGDSGKINKKILKTSSLSL